MIPQEPSDLTTARPLNSDADETHENELKSDSMKMIAALKEEIKNYLEEIEEKTNKKMGEIRKSFQVVKKTKKKQSNR